MAAKLNCQRWIAAPLMVATFIGIVGGCSSEEDQQFRAAVGPVLKQCGTVNAQVAEWEKAGQGFADKEERTAVGGEIDSTVTRFQSLVGELPQPKDKRLRYLGVRLGALGTSAAELMAARLETSRLRSYDNPTTMMIAEMPEERRDIGYQILFGPAQKKEAECERRFTEALFCVVSAEQLALGTATVRDVLEAGYLGGLESLWQTRERRDSIMAECDSIARSEIAAMP